MLNYAALRTFNFGADSLFLQHGPGDFSQQMNKDVLDFVTYCISKLAQILGLSQKEVYKKLYKSGILYEYLVPSYDVLHTFGSRYLMDDLIDFMKEKGVLDS